MATTFLKHCYHTLLTT